MKNNHLAISFAIFISLIFQSCNNNDDDNTINQQIITDSETIKITEDSNLGKVITDKNGNTLYYFSLDTSGESRCYGECDRAIVRAAEKFNCSIKTVYNILNS